MSEVFQVSGKILLAYVLVYIAIPAAAKKLLRGSDGELIPSSSGRYTYANILGSLVLFVPAIILFGNGPARVGFNYSANALGIGMLGAAVMAVFLGLFMSLLAADGKGQAKVLGLVTPGDYLVHSTWYAFVWAGFREELFFRGLVQTQVFLLLGGGWGLLAPLVYFSLHHAMNSDNPRVAAMWAASTLPGSLVFTLAYYLTGSLVAPVIAHGLNNSLAGLLTYLAVFKPAWVRPAAILTGLAGALAIFFHRGTVASLAAQLELGFRQGAAAGALVLAMLVAGTWAINHVTKRRSC